MSEVCVRKAFRICPKIPCGSKVKKEVLHPKTVLTWPYKIMVAFILLAEYAHLMFMPHQTNIDDMKSKVRQQRKKFSDYLGINR